MFAPLFGLLWCPAVLCLPAHDPYARPLDHGMRELQNFWSSSNQSDPKVTHAYQNAVVYPLGCPGVPRPGDSK